MLNFDEKKSDSQRL